VVRVVRCQKESDPAVQLATARALLQQVSSGEADDALRIYHPSRPVVAFGRRDTFLPGFTEAVRHVRDAGFVPLIRSVGGRAVAYTETALVLDAIGRSGGSSAGMDARFDDFGARYARALRDLGVDARVGAVPGEYCPGAQSVNARGSTKLVGTAQRVVRRAWLFSALVIVTDHMLLRPILGSVYRCLEQPFEESSVGSVLGEVPTAAADRVTEALITAHARGQTVEHVALDRATLELAHELAVDHRA
jgi:lipoate-protein ligase A